MAQSPVEAPPLPVAPSLLVSHQGEWTLDDLYALPDDGRRYEVVDGSLLVVNPPSTAHDFVVKRLQQALDPALRSGYEAFGPVGLQLGRTVRVPDVVVAPRDVVRSGLPALRPQNVLLVVEVQSPGTATTDRVTKMWEYAAAGIGHYWRVDPDDGPLLSAHLLAGDVYRTVGEWRGEQQAVLTAPVGLRLRPADLLR